ncbi:MAG: exonuclease RecJ [Halolamina sp.]|uniref:exonuclease RecJ n=1 Tax=Halolamina sp. TaxID=1940283 RepID=UPI002FC3CA63
MSSARPAVEDATAETLASAPFVRVVAASDGDSLAAAGILAGACEQRALPFQLRLGEGDATEDAVTVAVGPVGVEGDVTLSRPASPVAYRTATVLDADPDPVLTLAGTLAAGEGVESAPHALEAAESAGLIQRRPGVAIPTEEYSAGLAASTRLHAAFSGDESATAALVAELRDGEPDDEHEDATADSFDRRFASLVAIETVTADGASPRAADHVEQALHPYATADGPFATLGGYADVLGAVARTAPGAGIPLVLGCDDARDAALDAWRSHGETVHRLLREAETARHHELVVVRVPGSDPATLPAVARLFRDFRSPEPTVLAVTDGAAAAAGTSGAESVSEAITAAAAAVGGTARASETTGTARYDTDTTTFTDAFREAL